MIRKLFCLYLPVEIQNRLPKASKDAWYAELAEVFENFNSEFIVVYTADATARIELITTIDDQKDTNEKKDANLKNIFLQEGQ